ncbi:histidinol-phosphatase [soil metagenome]
MVSKAMSVPIYYDSHMHTPLCNHAVGEPEKYAEQALLKGLKAIIFTCHGPMPAGFWPQVRMSDAQFDVYVAMIERCRLRYDGQLEVYLGIESDYFPGHEKWSEKLHQRAPLHYVLGSVHWQGPEYRDRFEIGSAAEFRRTYFEHLADSAETGLFDSLAHPDLIKNYQPEAWNLDELLPVISSALDRIAKTGVAMELNTSGRNKTFPEMNPGPLILQMMCERGIPVVIGSDSHRPQRVGDNFIPALEILRQAGYDTVSVFHHRQRRELKILDVLPVLKSALINHNQTKCSINV